VVAVAGKVAAILAMSNRSESMVVWFIFLIVGLDSLGMCDSVEKHLDVASFVSRL